MVDVLPSHMRGEGPRTTHYDYRSIARPTYPCLVGELRVTKRGAIQFRVEGNVRLRMKAVCSSDAPCQWVLEA